MGRGHAWFCARHQDALGQRLQTVRNKPTLVLHTGTTVTSKDNSFMHSCGSSVGAFKKYVLCLSSRARAELEVQPQDGKEEAVTVLSPAARQMLATDLTQPQDQLLKLSLWDLP